MSELSKFRNTEGNNYLLIGAPNTGKSTIFNLLTTSTAIVSNIDRMTTEHTMGKIRHSQNYLIDLPGTYNLSHPIAEEKETHYHLLHHKVNSIVNVISSFSIQRDLFLTLQCIETGLLNTLCVNMMDLVNAKSFNWKKLSQKLNGVNVVLTRSNRNKNTKNILTSLYKSKKIDPKVVTYSNDIEYWISRYEKILPEMNVSKRFAALMLLENNAYFIAETKKHHEAYWPEISKILDKTKDKHYIHEIRATKIAFIEKVLQECKYDQKKYLRVNLTKQNRFDHYFLKKWIGIPLFLIIAVAIYYLSFGDYAGGGVQYWFGQALTNSQWGLSHWMIVGFNNWNAPEWVSNMIVNGIFGGLFTVLTFIPCIAILYICVTIIQQVGLLSRVSILLDNALSKFGISGRSVVNLLTAFGCNVPALMLARSSSSKKERIISVLIIPFIPCASKIIVIAAIANAIFLKFGWLFVFGAVILSGMIALLLGLTFSKTLFRKQRSFFCVEMVNWNGIDVRIMFKNVWQTIKGFLKKAILTITIANLIFWALLHLGNVPGVYIGNNADAQYSCLAYIGRGISYIFYPFLGSANWQLTSSLIAAIPAKELTLTTLNMLAGENAIQTLFNGNVALAISFMVFLLYYMPCIPSINTIRSEAGKKYMWINIGISFGIAYVMATLIYWVGFGISLVA
ncbi:MAG: ferrous iron transport protein B [Mycoplasma sp.]|nr:ferrous iron transport protein B [Candidatus Hennigella equi]